MNTLQRSNTSLNGQIETQKASGSAPLTVENDSESLQKVTFKAGSSQSPNTIL